MGMEFDPIGYLLAVIGLMYPVVTGRRERVRKEVSYVPNVVWKDSDVCEVHIRFFNSGTIAIRRDDYDRPFGFSFGESAQILTAESASHCGFIADSSQLAKMG